MIEWLDRIDRQLFIFLNGLHAPWLDGFMLYATDKMVSIPLYLVMLYIILREFRGDSWAPLVGVLVTVLLADQVTSSVMKPLFERLRPSRDPELAGLVHIVNGYVGGKYGFASSHAANTFGISFFLWSIFRQRSGWIALLFVWAALISYSRIYLGVHYPGDILAGIAVGLGAAAVGLRLHYWLLTFSRNRPAGKARANA